MSSHSDADWPLPRDQEMFDFNSSHMLATARHKEEQDARLIDDVLGGDEADQCTFSQDWQKPDGSKKSTADMSVISELCDIYCLLNFGAMDEMGDRIIELENSINDLIAEIRVDCSPYPLTPLKQRSGSAKQEDGSA
ncbi:hypothetical protein V6N13_137946 [Hibiscus sabdariffa]